MQSITPRELAERQQEGTIELIDVRTPLEFREVHASAARNVPLDSIHPTSLMQSRNGSSDDPLFIICRGGARGEQACQRFIEAGYHNVINVEGGTQAWEACGLPVVRGKKAVSLERQVRIAAGAIVLVSGLLAITVNPWFAAIAAAVGGGLALAGITDSCMMGMMLAKMPWNQVKDDSQCCSAS
jgi:rhodanese-related sulfurtransferase